MSTVRQRMDELQKDMESVLRGASPQTVRIIRDARQQARDAEEAAKICSGYQMIKGEWIEYRTAV